MRTAAGAVKSLENYPSRTSLSSSIESHCDEGPTLDLKLKFFTHAKNTRNKPLKSIFLLSTALSRFVFRTRYIPLFLQPPNSHTIPSRIALLSAPLSSTPRNQSDTTTGNQAKNTILAYFSRVCTNVSERAAVWPTFAAVQGGGASVPSCAAPEVRRPNEMMANCAHFSLHLYLEYLDWNSPQNRKNGPPLTLLSALAAAAVGPIPLCFFLLSHSHARSLMHYCPSRPNPKEKEGKPSPQSVFHFFFPSDDTPKVKFSTFVL